MPFLGSIFGFVLKFFTSGALTSITNWLTNKANAEAAMHEADTVAATGIIVAQLQAEIEARKVQASLASGHHTITSWVGAAFALHVWCITLDSIFHLGWNIAALPGVFGDYEIQYLLFLIGGGAVTSISRSIIAAVWKK